MILLFSKVSFVENELMILESDFLILFIMALKQEFPQPVVCVPLVVREGLPGGTRVTFIFSKKPGFTAF